MSNTIIQTNTLSLNSHRNLGLVNNNQKRSSERLSSGFRINSAADDAAGLGISEKMRAQIRGLDQASRNAQDGISLIQTAEGALDTINEILIRVRELVIQASNDTNVGGIDSQSDRLRIQDEIDQLMDEIDSIAVRTEFNTRILFDGSLHRDGVIRGGEWTTVEQLSTNAPAKIQTLDQFLRKQDRNPFVGSFADLLRTIGADLQGMSAEEWITLNFNSLDRALDIAMGVEFSGLGAPIDNTGRWDQARLTSGLQFADATDLLNTFVQGLHNPNALRTDSVAGTAQRSFDSWADFIEHANPAMGASTFARATSQTGGEAMYQALIRVGFRGLTADSSFSDVRNIFYTLGGGWARGFDDGELATALLTTSPGHNQSWLENLVGGGHTDIIHVSEITDLTGNGITTTPGASIEVGGEIHSGMMYTLTGSVGPGSSADRQVVPVARINTRDGHVVISVREFNPPADHNHGMFPDLVLYLVRPGLPDQRVGYSATGNNLLGNQGPGTWNNPTGTGTIFHTGWGVANEFFTVENLPDEYYIRVAVINYQTPDHHNFIIDIVGLVQEEIIAEVEPWEIFQGRYMEADTVITQRDVWVPKEPTRERGKALWFQTGANSSQGINVEIGSMSTGTLFGREGANHTQERRIINVLDTSGYNVQDGIPGGSNFGQVIGNNRVSSLLEALDEALAIATRQRSELGAIQNRLEFTIENVDIASENLNSANSRIRDADMAREMMSLTQSNVLQQAAISMLAQANQSPQAVLQLLA